MSTATATAAPVLLSFRDVLRIPVMRRVWYAQVVSLFGDFLALFAVIAVVSFRMHGTAAQLTGLQIAYMLPIVFVGPVASVAIVRPASLQTPSGSSSNRIHAIWIDMKAGWSFIIHHSAILFFVIAMAAGLFTIGCFGPLISIYVRDTLKADSGSFGYVSGMVGVGMLVGTQIVRQLAKRASPTASILTLVVRHGMGIALAGVGLGVAGAFALTRFMASLLFGVKAGDPSTFAAVCIRLAGVALTASYIPGRRAARIDPMISLRSD